MLLNKPIYQLNFIKIKQRYTEGRILYNKKWVANNVGKWSGQNNGLNPNGNQPLTCWYKKSSAKPVSYVTKLFNKNLQMKEWKKYFGSRIGKVIKLNFSVHYSFHH